MTLLGACEKLKILLFYVKLSEGEDLQHIRMNLSKKSGVNPKICLISRLVTVLKIINNSELKC